MKEPTHRKADRVATAIEAQIISGIRKPGARLDERSLAEEFNVSRTPVREAIQKLAANRLVTDNGRRGAVVTHLTVSSLLDAFLVVSELEGIAARLAARRMTPDEKSRAEAANLRCQQTAQDGDIAAFNIANMAFHDQIIAGSHNTLLQDQLTVSRVITFPYRHYVTQFPGYMLKSVGEHSEVLEAICCSDGASAGRLMCDHVNLQGEQIVDVVHFLEQQSQQGSEP
ncbi:MAG: GntR family transcriptional regulator [Paracoccaceae bacterium]|nr:GntR family transcriptional regulator [Paracoccaceae bacterium]